MRSKAYVVLAVLVVLASGAWAQDCQKDAVSVSGMGKVTVKPDVAYVALRVKGDGILMIDAAQKVQEKVAEIEKAIKAKGSAVKEIKVTDISVGQKDGSWSPDEADQARPEIVKQMTVTIPPDPKVAFDIVDAAIRAGASLDTSDSYSYGETPNSVIVYGLVKSEEAEAQAQAKALEDARSKASRLAALTGKTIGDVTSIGCEDESWSFDRDSDRFPITNLGVNPEGIDVTYSVSVSFALVKK